MSKKDSCLIHKLVTSKDPGEFLIDVSSSEYQACFPELYLCSKIKQRHGQTILSHIARVLTRLEVKNEITIAAALFHDIGKITTKKYINNKITFHDHPNHSSIVAKKYLKKWSYGDRFIHSVTRIVETHMFDIHTKTSDKNILNFIAKIGVNNLSNWFVLRRADALSYKDIKNSKILQAKEYIQKYIESFEERVLKTITDTHKKEKIDIEQDEFPIFGEGK